MILDTITSWAKENENVIALILTGSRSNSTTKPDDFSDYDIELILKRPQELTENNEWFHHFENVLVYEAFDDNQKYPTRLVVYKNGIKVDFTLADVNRIIQMNKTGLSDLYQRGYKVIIDKDNITNNLRHPSGIIKKNPPTEVEYQKVVNEFWFEASHIPKYLIRDELWTVKFRDWTMKEMLLSMLEWYTLSEDPNIDVWYLGSHMKSWLDAKIYLELKNTYSSLEIKPSWKSLIASTNLFRKTSIKVADHHQFKYPHNIDHNITQYIHQFSNKFE